MRALSNLSDRKGWGRRHLSKRGGGKERHTGRSRTNATQRKGGGLQKPRIIVDAAHEDSKGELSAIEKSRKNRKPETGARETTKKIFSFKETFRGEDAGALSTSMAISIPKCKATAIKKKGDDEQGEGAKVTKKGKRESKWSSVRCRANSTKKGWVRSTLLHRANFPSKITKLAIKE